MHGIHRLLFFLLLYFSATACTVREVNISTEKRTGTYTADENTDRSAAPENNNCGIANGTHHARVDYRNAVNGRIYSNDLEVEISDCRLVRIYFPEHLLDETNMTTVAVNSSHTAYATDHEGRHYTVRIADGVSPQPEAAYPPAAASRGGACNGSKSCSVCTNCTRCRYCHKNGGTCGVCTRK
jgi:hypothetical protein